MVQVVPHYAEIRALNTNVVVISFGTEYWARAWLEETNSPFPLLLDPKRQSYKAYKLEKSILHSWGWNNIRYHIRAIFKGEKWSGYRGDMNQLGGNFIVDAQGIIQFAYPSRDPTDRPSLKKLLTVLRQLN